MNLVEAAKKIGEFKAVQLLSRHPLMVLVAGAGALYLQKTLFEETKTKGKRRRRSPKLSPA